MIILENCPICETNNWHSLDYMRNQKYWYDKDMREEGEPVGFKVCKECGFLTYDYIDTERLAAFYDRQRPAMSPMNIITCNRKNQYHMYFLDRYIEQLPFDSNILDVGCAQGSFLAMLKSKGFENLYGTEYSEAYRSFGNFEYDLNITKEIDLSIKYDFISYYHVFEHIQYPGEELKKIRDILTDDGYVYFSVPDYLDTLEEKGGSIANDFEGYYHLNHVNCFSFQSFKNILNKYGFEIIEEDTFLYGYTVLCKKSKQKDIVKENYLSVISILDMQKRAIDLLLQKKYKEAYELYPKYPDAYVMYSLSKDNMKEFEPQVAVLEEGLKNNPDNYRIKNQLAKVYFQWDENTPDKQYYSNNIKKAQTIFEDLYNRRPGAEENLYFLAIIYAKYKKEYDVAVSLLHDFMDINPIKFQEGYSLIANFWKEKAKNG